MCGLVGPLGVQHVQSMRTIPEDNLAYPVLIALDTESTGSGFFLRANDVLYLVTAKHVLVNPKNDSIHGKSAELTCQTKDIRDRSVSKITIDLTKVELLKHADADVAAIKMGTTQQTSDAGSYSITYSDGVSVTARGKGGIVHVLAGEATKLLEEVLVSNDVILYGYPTSLNLLPSLSFDFSRPLLRKGIIANVYPEQGTIILDCPAYYGNSGGPVVEIDPDLSGTRHKVIGVVSEFIPFIEPWENKQNGLVQLEVSNSGYSVAVSMDKVFELISFKKGGESPK